MSMGTSCRTVPSGVMNKAGIHGKTTQNATSHFYLYFYSSLAKTEPTRLHPEEPKFEAKKYFHVIILLEQPNQNMQVETFAYFPHFQSNMHFQFGFLLKESGLCGGGGGGGD